MRGSPFAPRRVTELGERPYEHVPAPANPNKQKLTGGLVMSLLNALTLAIGVLAAVATWLFLGPLGGV